jgi:hypothetical protein
VNNVADGQVKVAEIEERAECREVLKQVTTCDDLDDWALLDRHPNHLLLGGRESVESRAKRPRSLFDVVGH